MIVNDVADKLSIEERIDLLPCNIAPLYNFLFRSIRAVENRLGNMPMPSTEKGDAVFVRTYAALATEKQTYEALVKAFEEIGRDLQQSPMTPIAVNIDTETGK